jgi:hypothetical protein
MSKSRTRKDATSIVRKESAILESKANVGLILICIMKIWIQYHLVAYNKNVFFQNMDCGRTVTKIRSSLNDKSLDILTFLRGSLSILVLLFVPNFIYYCFQLNLIVIQKYVKICVFLFNFKSKVLNFSQSQCQHQIETIVILETKFFLYISLIFPVQNFWSEWLDGSFRTFWNFVFQNYWYLLYN